MVAQAELSIFEKCVLKGESGKYLVDKGRVLEFTSNKDEATVYSQKNAHLKIINWPNTLLIMEPTKAKEVAPVVVSDWDNLLIRVQELGFTAYRLARVTALSEDSWHRWLKGERRPTATKEKKIAVYLDGFK
jgi:hypothetical protein